MLNFSYYCKGLCLRIIITQIATNQFNCITSLYNKIFWNSLSHRRFLAIKMSTNVASEAFFFANCDLPLLDRAGREPRHQFAITFMNQVDFQDDLMLYSVYKPLSCPSFFKDGVAQLVGASSCQSARRIGA